jgi:hypothetical protein
MRQLREKMKFNMIEEHVPIEEEQEDRNAKKREQMRKISENKILNM